MLYAMANSVKAQSVFPTDGTSVGIGTNTPISTVKLHITDGGTGASASELLTLQTSYGLSGRKSLTWRDPANITCQIDNYYDGTYTNMSFGHLYSAPLGGYQTTDILTLKGNGNVGIGTTSPQTALDVNSGTVVVSGTSSSFGSANRIQAELYNPTTTSTVLRSYNRGATIYGDIGISELTRFMVQGSTGNVGIGTTSPSAALQILRTGANSGADYPALHITTSGTGNIYGPILYLNGTSGTNGRMWGLVSSGPLDAAATGSAGNFAIYDTNAGSRLVINSSGNVGIGTTDPGNYKLGVNGTIHSKAVVIDLIGWSDYVFDKDYILKPLNEVADYIYKNKHLPDVPTAAEIKKDGVNVGETEALLLKKVEELTLYLIEKDKKIELLEKRLEKLEAINNK